MLNCKHGSSHGSVPLDWPESVKQQQGHLQGKGLEAGQELSLQVCPYLCSQKVRLFPPWRAVAGFILEPALVTVGRAEKWECLILKRIPPISFQFSV